MFQDISCWITDTKDKDVREVFTVIMNVVDFTIKKILLGKGAYWHAEGVIVFQIAISNSNSSNLSKKTNGIKVA